jgi:hypothetical protein
MQREERSGAVPCFDGGKSAFSERAGKGLPELQGKTAFITGETGQHFTHGR